MTIKKQTADLPKSVWTRLYDKEQRDFCLLLLPRSDKKNSSVYRVCPYFADSIYLNNILTHHGDRVVIGYYKPSNDPQVALQIAEDIEATRVSLNATIPEVG